MAAASIFFNHAAFTALFTFAAVEFNTSLFTHTIMNFCCYPAGKHQINHCHYGEKKLTHLYKGKRKFLLPQYKLLKCAFCKLPLIFTYTEVGKHGD